MTVIAMTREMGTQGKDVAQTLADQMGLRVVHHELVEHDLAEHLRMSESAVHRYLEGNVSLFEKWKVEHKQLARYTAEEILHLAHQGGVIIRGWGAAALLWDVPHVLCVRVCAPMAFRERIMMERLGVNDAAVVRREIELNDAAHLRATAGLFGRSWEDPNFYHLVLNTSVVPVETCVASLRQLVESPSFQETEETRAVIGDKLIEARIRSLLTNPVEHKAGFGTINVVSAQGTVTLTGMVFARQLVNEILRLVQSVEGVVKIDNRIVVTHLRPSSM